MRREVKKYLLDLRQAIALIQSFTAGKDFSSYESDLLLRAAVERELITIGEAAVQLARLDPGVAEQIREIRRIISFRNRLVHLYDDLDFEIVWDVLTKDVPNLQEDVDRLLESD
jgi:uncharacterized protein with HEPN domain